MPELELVSVIIASNSRTKSPVNFLSDTRNEFGEFITVVPTIMPSSTLYSAFPVINFQPLRVFPSNSDCQPCEKTDEDINRKKIISIFFMKIDLKSQVKEDFNTELQRYRVRQRNSVYLQNSNSLC